MINNIPQELRQLPQWACARADKAPLDVKTGKLADPTDPATWATFEQACAYADQYGLHVGFMLSADDPFCIIDLDDKPAKPATEAQKIRHRKILDACQSYTERSSGGRGFHIVVRGSVPSGVHRDNVEIYSEKRFMICTGAVVRPLPIVDQQHLLDVLYAEMTAQDAAKATVDVPPLPPIDDEEVLTKARTMYGHRFESLWSGDWQQLGIGDGSQSAADFDLAVKLCEFTSDDEQVKRLFLQSALGQRDKAAKRKGYLDKQTIPKARRAADAERAKSEVGRRLGQALVARWQAETDAETAQGFSLPIPRLRPEAYYGILGEIAVAGSEQTEAVPAALAINTLARFCATVGPALHVTIGDDWRSLRPFTLIVGPTSKGRKGTSAQLPNRIFAYVDQLLGWPLRYETSVSSGEGLVWMVRDEKRTEIKGVVVVEDPGITDKRVLLEISEFSGVLAQAKREASVLTSVLRDAWDGRRLSTPNKNTPCSATSAHFVVLGHITREELTKLLTNTDIKNGFANRFMMVYSARQRIVDDPQPTEESAVHGFAQRIAAAVSAAWARHSAPVQLSDAARQRWIQIRRDLENRTRTSVLESLMARADTYVRILAPAIALINQEQTVEREHLDAALAWVDHWEDTANFCFTAAAQYDEMVQSKTLADEIIEAVRKHGGRQVPRTVIYDELTNRGKRKDRSKAIFEKAIAALQNEAPPRIVISKIVGKGRPTNLFSLAA